MFSFKAFSALVIHAMHGLLPHLPPPFSSWCTEAAAALTQRQVWGLVVRNERTIRAISPRTGNSSSNSSNSSNSSSSNSSSSSSNSSPDTVHQLFGSVGWQSPSLVVQAGEAGEQTAVALIRILASYAASSVKAAALHDGRYGPTMASRASVRVSKCWNDCLSQAISSLKSQGEAQQLEQAAGIAAAQAVFCRLLPRLAALPSKDSAAMGLYMLSQLTICLQRCPERSLRLLTSCHVMQLVRGSVLADTDISRTRWETCQDIGLLADLACAVARMALQLVAQGCDGAPPGSPQLHDLLARPLLQLLNSPLLDLLAGLQHVPVSFEAAGVILASSFCPPCGVSSLHQMPETVQPDADDTKLAMQVRSARCTRWVGVVCGSIDLTQMTLTGDASESVMGLEHLQVCAEGVLRAVLKG